MGRYRYYKKVPGIEGRPDGWWVSCAKEEWLARLMKGEFNPKPPPWWVEEQERENQRSPKSCGVIWNTAYKPERKFLIWSQAPDSDFTEMGYLY